MKVYSCAGNREIERVDRQKCEGGCGYKMEDGKCGFLVDATVCVTCGKKLPCQDHPESRV